MWFAPAILFASGFVAGLMNSVAGGGSMIIYPALVALGIPPITANATTSFSVLPGTLSSAFGYRNHLTRLPKRYYCLMAACTAGGLLGAHILRMTSDVSFTHIVPWFLAFAVGLIIFQPAITKWAKSQRSHRRKDPWRLLGWLGMAMFCISIYGGYFGAGYAIVVLALLGFTERTDIHEMNGFKSLLSATVNITSSTYLIIHGLVQWTLLPWLMAGNIVGGYLGARYSTYLSKGVVRLIIIAIGSMVVTLLFIHS